MFEAGNNQAILGPRVYEFENDYFICKNKLGESKLKWEAITNMGETDKYLFQYILSLKAHVIPKFKLGAQEKNIIKFIKQKIQKIYE